MEVVQPVVKGKFEIEKQVKISNSGNFGIFGLSSFGCDTEVGYGFFPIASTSGKLLTGTFLKLVIKVLGEIRVCCRVAENQFWFISFAFSALPVSDGQL